MATTATAPCLTEPATTSTIRKLSRAHPSPRVPSLPKLHGRNSLITTKLCETIHKSTVGHMFDLSNPKEYSSFTEYNSLHDPHLKAYFYHPDMKKKLIDKGFITGELRVICSMKEYNAYRNFLEMESMKLRKKENEEKERERRQKTEKEERKSKQSRVNEEREERRKRFFWQQNQKLHARQLQLQHVQRQEELAKLRAVEQRRIEKERNEIRREAEIERRRMEKMQQEQEEALTRKRLLNQTEKKNYTRMLHLHKVRQDVRVKHLNELQSRWQAYEDHAKRLKQQEERKKTKELEEKEKRKRRREKLFLLLQNREEERKKKLMEENHHQVELLKEQADQLEKQREKRKNLEVNEWHEKFHKQQEHWKHHLDHQRELRKKETEKHIDDLLHHSHPPVVACTKKSGRHRLTSRATSASSCGASAQSSALNVVKPGGGRVRFDSTLTVHTLDQDMLLEEKEEVEDIENTCEVNLASGNREFEISQNSEDMESEVTESEVTESEVMESEVTESEVMESEDTKVVNMGPDLSQPDRGNPSVDGGDGADSYEGEEKSSGLMIEEGDDTSQTSIHIENLEGTVNSPDNAEASPRLASPLEGVDDEAVIHKVGSKLAAEAVQGAVRRMTPPPI